MFELLKGVKKFNYRGNKRKVPAIYNLERETD